MSSSAYQPGLRRAPLTALLTVVALSCFEPHSLLVRVGLGTFSGDPVLFTWVRLSARALCLVLLTGRAVA